MSGTFPNLTEGQQSRSGVSAKFFWCSSQRSSVKQLSNWPRRRFAAVTTSGIMTCGDEILIRGVSLPRRHAPLEDDEIFGDLWCRERTPSVWDMDQYAGHLNSGGEGNRKRGLAVRPGAATPTAMAWTSCSTRSRRRPRGLELPTLSGRFVEIGKRDIRRPRLKLVPFRQTRVLRRRPNGCPRIVGNAWRRSYVLPNPHVPIYQDSEAFASLSRRLFGRMSGQFCSI